MKVHIEEVPEIEERIVTYRYAINNFNPDAVRKSLKRALRRSEQGPEECVNLIIIPKKDAPGIPEILTLVKNIHTWTLGSVSKGRLEIGDPEATDAQAEAGEDCTLLLPLAAIEAMQVEYRRWEPA